MAGFGTNFQGHFFAVLGRQSVEEAAGLFGDAFLALVNGMAVLTGLFAVPSQTDLPHNAFKQLSDIVVQRC